MRLPELLGASIELGAAGFEVTDPVVDHRSPGGHVHLVADRSRAILRVDRVGTFAIAQGSQIRFESEPDAPPGLVSTWLQGTVVALLLAQRGAFALHASVVEVRGRGIAVTGRRRAGKSTTALRLVQKGHTLVTDDVSPLENDALITVLPFARPLHVSPETADGLGLDISDARPIMPEHPKVALPVAPRAPVPLSAIVVLRVRANATVESVRVRGTGAHSLVRANVYRVRFLRELCQAEMFGWAGMVASRIPVHLVTRPSEGWTVDAVADAVERVAADCADDPV